MRAPLLVLLVACGSEPDTTPDRPHDSRPTADDAGSADTGTWTADALVPPDDLQPPQADDTSANGDTGEIEVIGAWDDDLDKDGWSIGEGDCDDADPIVHPGYEEVPGNGVDEDCDGSDVGPTLRLDAAAWSFQGLANNQVGYAVEFAGDTNGDGVQEAIAGAPDGGGVDWNGYQARGYLVDLAGTATAGTARATIVPDEYNSGSGKVVAGGGDLNGDGYDDVAFGMWYSDAWDDYANITGGQVLVYFGPLSGTLREVDADVRLHGTTGPIQFGLAVSMPPSETIDGGVDLLIGAPDSGGIGTAYLWQSLDGGTQTQDDATVIFRGESLDGRAGWNAQSAGDLNADGVGDLYIPELESDYGGDMSGRVFLATGPFEGEIDLESAYPSLVGEGESSNAGMDVSPAGDVDFDGYDDVLIGGHMDPEVGTRAGKAWLVHGPVSSSQSLLDADARFLPERDYEWFGYSVVGMGDANGDGSLDIAIGAPRYDADYYLDYPGKVYIYSTPLSGTILAADASLVIQGEGIGDWAGAALDGGRDIDLDGRPDLLVSGSLRDDVSHEAGKLYLLTGLEY